MFKKPYKSKPHAAKKPYDNAMHTATCSGCGKDCEVPFKPNGKKPVFCSTCYIREDKPDKFSKRSPDGKRDSSDFYEKKNQRISRSAADGITVEQFKSLEAKLDLVIKLLSDRD